MKLSWLLSTCALAASTIAAAQTAPAQVADTPTGNNSDIIVTATRRSETLSNVPIAVSAVSAAALKNSGANDIRSLNQLAPSLLVSSTGTESNGSARIRGIGTVGDNPGLESSVAVFIDGVYRSRTGVGLNELGEIDRIEVLRGPQGTLFGRNASAGLINIVSAKPSFDFGGNAEASYGNYNYYRLAGGVTGPILGDKIAARIDGVYVNRKGFYRDVISGGDVNDRNRYFIKGQLLIKPTDDINIRLIGDYSHRDEKCCAATFLPVREGIKSTPSATTAPFDVTFQNNRILDVLTNPTTAGFGAIINQNTFSRDVSVTPGRTFTNHTTDYGLSGELNWRLGGLNLTSITAYRQYKAETPGDVDYNNVDILYRADDGKAFRQFKTFSQELRLQGSLFDDHLDFLVGGYYANEKLKLSENLKFGADYGEFAACRLVTSVSANAVLRNRTLPGCLSPTGRATFAGAFGGAAPIILNAIDRLSTVNNVGANGSIFNQTSDNYAVFTHNVIKLTDALSVTLGARYTHEKKTLSGQLNNTNTVCPVQQAFLSPYLTGGTTPLPASLQAFLGGLANLTCQGNASSALNNFSLNDQRSESKFTGTAVVSYKVTPGLLTYASYSRGYKAGGFNLDPSALGSPVFAPSDPRNVNAQGKPFGTALLQFDPETVDAFEIGAKFKSRQFNLNVAIFHEDFSSFQLNTFNGSSFLVQTVNGCSVDLAGADRDSSSVTGACTGKTKPGVTSQGFELEAALFPADNLAVNLGFTYADTKYAKNLVGNQSGAALDNALFLLPGQQLSNAPKYVATGSLAFTPPIGTNGLSALFYTDFRYSSGYNTGSDLFPEKVQEGFIVINARVGLRGKDERFSIELWAQNLLNTNYQQVAFNAPFLGANSSAQTVAFGSTSNQIFGSFLAEPRTFGATVRTKF